jgi:four helix bundle suffix protein
MAPDTPGFILPHGGYRSLLSYQKAEVIHDLTVVFCDRFIDRRSRTHDQMVQAARSGKQNIVEGSMASGTSNEMELKLTGVARASLEELLADYLDFLRQHSAPIWEKSSREAAAARRLGTQGDVSRLDEVARTRPADVVANVLVCLIHQANYLLDRQLRQLEQSFVTEGGLRKRMTRARLAERDRQRREP